MCCNFHTFQHSVTFHLCPHLLFLSGSVAIDGADDIEYATVWLYVSCVLGLCFLVVLVMLAVCLLR